LLLAQIGLFYHLTTSYLYSITPTRGISMLPTMPARGSWSLCSHLYRHGKNIKVGDVIVFDHPIIAGGRAAKRVIGLEGDFVCVITPGKQREGEDEELSATRTVVTHEMVQVPKGHCWVEGDNLDWSRDSRVYGAVPLNLVRSKVVACVWPPGEWKGAENGLQD
ncbi:LexA/Signal peptidase, partial [Delitschia confertaspora ATCC 74209]